MRSGIIYFALGGLFIYIAILNATETIWNPMSIILLAVAAIDIGMGFTMLRNYLKQKNADRD